MTIAETLETYKNGKRVRDTLTGREGVIHGTGLMKFNGMNGEWEIVLMCRVDFDDGKYQLRPQPSYSFEVI